MVSLANHPYTTCLLLTHVLSSAANLHSNQFECGGSNSSPQSLECVGNNLVCNNEEDCSVNCFDGYGNSERGLCGTSDPGCCESHIQCPINGICSIQCSYSCQNMVIDATLSAAVRITNCTGYSCNNLTVYCPDNNMDDSCHLESNDDLLNLQIYLNRNNEIDELDRNLNIMHDGRLQGVLHCTYHDDQCLMDTVYPSLCEGEIPLICNSSMSSDLDIYAVQQDDNGMDIWLTFIILTIAIAMTSVICVYFCCKFTADDGEEKDGNKEHEEPPTQERVFSATEHEEEGEGDGQRRMSHFKYSLSVQIHQQQLIMDDVVREMRRDSEWKMDEDQMRKEVTEELKAETKDESNERKQIESAIVSEDLNKLKSVRG